LTPKNRQTLCTFLTSTAEMLPAAFGTHVVVVSLARRVSASSFRNLEEANTRLAEIAALDCGGEVGILTAAEWNAAIYTDDLKGDL
jgi:hypothetical protein